MNRILKLIIFGVMVFVAVLALNRMMRPALPAEDKGETDAIVSRLIENDRLITPAPAGRGSNAAR